MKILLTLLMTAQLCSFWPGPASGQTIAIVRHAETASDSDDPSLSEAGRDRAAALSEALSQFGADLILTSQFARARETAAFLGEAEIIDFEGSGDDYGRELAHRLSKLRADDAAIVVTHCGAIPSLVSALGGPNADGLGPCSHDRLIILTDGTPRLIIARIGDAPRLSDK